VTPWRRGERTVPTLVNRSKGTKLFDYKDDDNEQQCYDLIAKVKWLINSYPGWSEDGTFTFPDGETWAKLDIEGEQDSE
jgi:hypothetical protein